MLSALGLVVALVLLIFGAYKRVGIFPMTLICSLIVILTSGLPLWDSYGTTYVTAFAGPFRNYILLFAASCLYSKVMELSGSATTIAHKIIGLVGEKNVVTASCIAGAILTYGGVSGFVLSYVLVPVMYGMFYRANIHRKYMYAVVMISCGTWTAGFLPYSASVSNVVPGTALGVGLGSAPLMGIVTSIILFVIQLIYINREVKKSQARGDNFAFGPSVNPETYTNENDTDLPSAFVAFFPLIAMIVSIIVGSQFGINGTMLAVVALLGASILCYLFNMRRLNAQDPKSWLTTALATSITSISGLAAVTGFAAVVALAPAYMSMLDTLIASSMNPYIKASLASFMFSLVSGSSSAGVGIVAESPELLEYFMTCGASLPIISRLISMFSMPGSALPNCAGNYVHLSVVELTQADCYPNTFRINFLFPIIICVGALAVAVLFL